MKKLIAMLLALVMVLALAACNNTEAPSTTPAATENTPADTTGATEEATEPAPTFDLVYVPEKSYF